MACIRSGAANPKEKKIARLEHLVLGLVDSSHGRCAWSLALRRVTVQKRRVVAEGQATPRT